MRAISSASLSSRSLSSSGHFAFVTGLPPESCGENPPRLALRQLILARDLSHRRAAFAGAAHLAVAKQAAHRGRARHFDELARVVAAQRARVAYADQLRQFASLVRLAWERITT